MLVKLCLEKEQETFILEKTVLVGLLDAVMDPENDKAASEALAALQIAIKNSIQVGPAEFGPEIEYCLCRLRDVLLKIQGDTSGGEPGLG